MRQPHGSSGFTLMELMIALLLAAVLVSFALPAYSTYVLRSQRAVGKAFLTDLVMRQEQWLLRTRAYATGFGPLIGTEGREITIDRGGMPVPAGSSGAIYRIRFAEDPAPSATAFVFIASAVGRQLRDTDCLTFAVHDNGSRSANGSAGEAAIRTCWER